MLSPLFSVLPYEVLLYIIPLPMFASFSLLVSTSCHLPIQWEFIWHLNPSDVSICIQDDSLGGHPKLLIINHALIYQWKLNLVSMYRSRWGGNWITEGAEIGFQPRHRSPHSTSCSSQVLQLASWQEGSQTERTGTNWAGWHQVNVAEYMVLPAMFNFNQ
jgi:hypothetical protein